LVLTNHQSPFSRTLTRAPRGLVFCHSSSISFCGQYRAACGRSIRGRMAPAITYGHSKAHRPDLKQLLFILTVEGEGVPCQFSVNRLRGGLREAA
jgi:transposase